MAKADSATTPEDTPVTIAALSNDTDVDADTDLNKGTPVLVNTLSITGAALSNSAHGTVKVEDNKIVYAPAANWFGSETITYTIADGDGGTATGSVAVTVSSVNDKPTFTVTPPDIGMDEDETDGTTDFTVADVETDAGELTVAYIGSTNEGLIDESCVSITAGTGGERQISVSPKANQHGEATITINVTDGDGATNDGTMTFKVTVAAVNDAPEATVRETTTLEDTAKAIDVAGLIRDADIATDNDALSVSVRETDAPGHGTVSVQGTVVTYTPNANWNGVDHFYYTATDQSGASASALVTIGVSQVNDAPVATTDSIETKEDASVAFNPLANDTDVDTDAALNAAPMDAPVLTAVGMPSHGTAAIVSGRVVYTPKANYNGPDSFSYTISDGAVTVTGAVSVFVTQVNDLIQARNDEATTTDEDAVTIDVLANDTDVDTDAALNLETLHATGDFRIVLVGSAAHGTTEISNGRIIYTPEDTFNGADSFTYTVSDGHGSSASATVAVTVLPQNDPPETPVVSTPVDGDRAGGSSIVSVAWSCFDIDGDVLYYTLEYYNNGAWTVAGSGLTATEYDFAIPSAVGTTDGLRFRVKAADSEYTTDYGYSGAMSVDRDAPVNVVVSMTTEDGNAYTEGVWTNQTVTVTALSVDDANPVTFQYGMDGGVYSSASELSVTSDEHSVYILATDVFSNSAAFGGYLARVDKQAPAVPTISEQTDGGSIVISFKLKADPGGSGNDRLVLPNGKTLSATAALRYSVTKNGTYTFTLYDVAGNKTTFSYKVDSVDTSKPSITARYGSYRIGETTQGSITVQLTFTDEESELTGRGYELSTSIVPNAIYRDYTGAIIISSEGVYYVHAYAMNAFGLAEYETFGPFIIEAAPVADAAEDGEAGVTPTPEPTTEPEFMDVQITTEDIQNIPGETVSIRLPGEEWGDTLTLENVTPGEYYIEAMDDSGNIHTVKVRVTMRDIIARSLRNARGDLDFVTIAGMSAGAAGLLLLIILLLGGYNISFSVFGFALSDEKRLRKLRRIMFRKETLVIRLKGKQVRNGEYGVLRIAKHLTKRMRNRTIVVEVDGREVLRELIPEDMDQAFKRDIPLGK